MNFAKKKKRHGTSSTHQLFTSGVKQWRFSAIRFKFLHVWTKLHLDILNHFVHLPRLNKQYRASQSKG